MALTYGSSTNLRDAEVEVFFSLRVGCAYVLLGGWTRSAEIPDDNDEFELAREDTLETLLLELEEEEEEDMPLETLSILILPLLRVFFAFRSLLLAKSSISSISFNHLRSSFPR